MVAITSPPLPSSSPPPLIDNRTPEEILEQIRELARSYLPDKWIFASRLDSSLDPFDWNKQNPAVGNIVFSNFDNVTSKSHLDDLGISISKLFASIYFNVISRLNKLPQKNFISYLNILGFGLSSPLPAKVPVTFKLTEKATNDVFVPAGTVVAADPNDRHEKELVFETMENMLVTKAVLDQVFTIDTMNDALYGHIGDIQSGEPFNFFFDLKNGNIQKHILYLGHDEIFNFKTTPVIIEINIFPFLNPGEKKTSINNLVALLKDENKVSWEYGWEIDEEGNEKKNSALKLRFVSVEEDPRKKTSFSKKDEDDVDDADSSLIYQTILLSNQDNGDIKENKKVKINGIEKYWIRCRILSNDFSTQLNLATFEESLAIGRIIVNMRLDENLNVMGQNIKDDSSKLKKNSGNGKKASKSSSISELSNYVDPDMLFYKDTPLNQSDVIIYPFGIFPFTSDAFYIGSNVCFSKKNSFITLLFTDYKTHFNGSHQDSDEPNIVLLEPEPVLSWEYWNGTGWNLLEVNMNEGSPFSTTKEITFTCPNDISITKINGFENYWVRVRLSSGNYGNGETIQTTTYDFSNFSNNREIKVISTTGWEYSKVRPPEFGALKVKFEYILGNILDDSEEHQNLELIKSTSPFCLTFNNLEYVTHSNSNNEIISPFRPFVKFNDAARTPDDHLGTSGKSFVSNSDGIACFVYMGFTSKLETGPYHIYLSVIEKKEIPDYLVKALNFYYYSQNDGWKKLIVDDDTNYFTKKGTLKFSLPSDFENLNLFGQNLYWIKIEDPSNIFHTNISLLPQLDGVYPNTVMCINSSLVKDEILHKDETDLDLPRYIFLNKPLLYSNETEEQTGNDDADADALVPDIWIREDQNLSKKEREILIKNNRLRELPDPSGTAIETWIKWTDMNQQVINGGNNNSFFEPAILSRRYYIDKVNGLLTFGPVFENYLQNIPSDRGVIRSLYYGNVEIEIGSVKVTYRTGGGTFGNIKTGEITKLKSLIPSIDSIVNNLEGEGGSDVQTIESAVEQWPQLLKNRKQAVTTEDYENLIKTKFMSVSRLKCFSTTNKYGQFEPGHILVVVIPKVEEDNEVSEINPSSMLPKKEKKSSIESISKNNSPYPSLGLIENIKEYLEVVSSNVVVFSKNLHVRGPLYYGVSVSAKIFVKDVNVAFDVQSSALNLLNDYLHPSKGGPLGQGWDFGKMVFPSDILSLFYNIKEIHHIENVSIGFRPDEIDDKNLEIVKMYNEQFGISSNSEDRKIGFSLRKDESNDTILDDGARDISEDHESMIRYPSENADEIQSNSFVISDDDLYPNGINDKAVMKMIKHGLIYDSGNHNLQINILE